MSSSSRQRPNPLVSLATATSTSTSTVDPEGAMPEREVGLRQRLFALADALASERLRRRAKRTKGDRQAPPASGVKPPGTVEIDGAFDTAWADPDARFSGLVHAFHLEWHGIRAASGYLPGSKVGFTANRDLLLREIQEIAAHCARPGVRAVLFHGFSENMEDVIRSVRRVTSGQVRLALVWHGSTAQFHAPAERDGFTTALELRRSGIVDVLACVKPEMELLSPLIHGETLLNLPPTVSPSPAPLEPTGAVFVPMPADWWKNPHTNVIAAARSPSVRRIYCCAALEQPKAFGLTTPLEVLGRLKRDEIFRVLRRIDAVLNVSLAECQPMTALESVAHGVACLTGTLSLGALDAHPYQQLVQVPGTGSLRAISEVIERVLALRRDQGPELADMIGDFRTRLTMAAKERLGNLVLS